MDFVIGLLQWGPSITMIAFGISQWRHPEKWLEYIPLWIMRYSFTGDKKMLMRFHSLGNIVFGVFLFSTLYPLLGAWVAFLWWLSILPLAFRVDWTIGMRDLSITISLAALVGFLMF
ncbi:MAG: hypothetical protein Q7S15_00020 [bacterium]|nr:hypothetical protein [bacterium]